MLTPESLDESEHPSAADLTAFGLGLPTIVDSAAIAMHLDQCKECESLAGASARDRFVDLVREAGVSGSNAGPARPRLVQGYEVLHELGRGGMGIVFLARQVGVGRLVALKFLRTGMFASREELLRFRREAEAMGRLEHAHIVRVYDSGEQNGTPYLALEYVRGEALATRMKSRPLSAREAVELLATMARAVAYAHSLGIVHRDLKPGNVLLQPDPDAPDGVGLVKIADFGLARTVDGAEHTLSGQLLGTPAYMAPEQISGPAEAIGPACDIFAMGAILYEALAGKPPFRAKTVVETLDRVRKEAPAALRTIVPGVATDLEAICSKCLEKLPEDRYPSSTALAEELQHYLDGEPLEFTRGSRYRHQGQQLLRRLLALAALLIGLASVGGALLWSGTWQSQRAESESALAANAVQLEGLTLWLRADRALELDEQGRVRRWRDQSPGPKHDATQLFADCRPRWIADGLNGQPVLRFNGTSDAMNLAGQILSSQEFTIVVVASYSRVSGKNGPHELISNWDGAKQRKSVFVGVMDIFGVFPRFTDDIGGLTDENVVLTQRALIKNPVDGFVLSACSTKTNAEVFVNSTRLISAGRPLGERDLSGVWRLGSQGAGYEFWRGDMAEVLVYDRTLSDAELRALWSHLRATYFPHARW